MEQKIKHKITMLLHAVALVMSNSLKPYGL